MDLPIDARTGPFREKYLDSETEILRRWFVFGFRADGNGVDIADGQQDIFVGVTLVQAQRIVAAREAFVDEIISTLNTEQS